MTTVSLRDIKAIDVHTHPFSANASPYTEIEFIRHLSLATVPYEVPNGYIQAVKEPFPGTNMWMQILITRLADYYGCERSLQEVVKQRNEKANNFKAYTRDLFTDAGISGVVADFGWPIPEIDKAEYAGLCGVRIWEVHRIESVMDRLRQSGLSFGEFIEQYRADLRNALNQAHVVGLKSTIAYYCGLEIAEKNEAEAAEQYPEFIRDAGVEAKAFRDFCLHVAMEECTAAEKYMHIHTGIGNCGIVLPKASPSFLVSMLYDKKYAETKVHLVHGGYPWVEEAAFIVGVLPNVFMDISLQNPFVGHGVERILSQIFEFAPFNKVMYGSDAFPVVLNTGESSEVDEASIQSLAPEMNWMGVHLFKDCFERVLNGWVRSDYIDIETAKAIGEMVLYRNFENAYRKFF